MYCCVAPRSCATTPIAASINTMTSKPLPRLAIGPSTVAVSPAWPRVAGGCLPHDPVPQIYATRPAQGSLVDRVRGHAPGQPTQAEEVRSQAHCRYLRGMARRDVPQARRRVTPSVRDIRTVLRSAQSSHRLGRRPSALARPEGCHSANRDQRSRCFTAPIDAVRNRSHINGDQVRHCRQPAVAGDRLPNQRQREAFVRLVRPTRGNDGKTDRLADPQGAPGPSGVARWFVRASERLAKRC